MGPIWGNTTYAELAKLQQGPRWRALGVAHLDYIFQDRRLLPFPELQRRFALPSTMLYYYMQLHHAVQSQGNVGGWVQSPTPIFHLLQTITETRLPYVINRVLEGPPY